MAVPQAPIQDSERARLAWRCRRGRREWDLLLLDWLGRHYASSTAVQRARFAAVLELPDPELERYLLEADHPLQAELPEPQPQPQPGNL
jgi:succinate dehydrogenase flavin-adding protein (antitoxin of CptAB toxin-antitoxin module)